MKIVHVTATFPPYYGGTGTVCYHNARILAERGHEVHVFTAATAGEPDDPPGVTVHRLKPIVHVGNAPVLPQLLRLPSDAIVHVHFPFYAGAELVAMTRRPYVVTYHQDVDIGGWIGKLTSLHDSLIGRRVLRRAARLCPTSLDYFQSSKFADLIPEMGDRLIPLPNGVDTNQFHPGAADPAIRARYRLPEGAPVVLFVGSMDAAHHFKGVKTLLKALAQTPEVTALFVGDGNLRRDYEGQANTLGIAERVRFIGRVHSAELPGIYRIADLLALPSETRGEAFGVVLLEAMASGIPVIASNLPGVRSVVADGDDGFLVSPGNPDELARAIQRLTRMDANARQQMAINGRHKAEAEFDWERIGDRLETLYRNVQQEMMLSQ